MRRERVRDGRLVEGGIGLRIAGDLREVTPESAATGLVVAGAGCPTPTVVAFSITSNPTPMASCGPSLSCVTNTAFQAPVAGNVVLAT